MDCPRLDHFVNIMVTGLHVRCCHMVDPPRFETYSALTNSQWLADTKEKISNGVWPEECIRCKQEEDMQLTSIRQHAIEFDKKQTLPSYLVADVVLDNVCNSACQHCNPYSSTLIGGLLSKDYYQFDSMGQFNELPLADIISIDLTGGEPSTSKNARKLFTNLPHGVKNVRINTNAMLMMPGIQQVVDRGVNVTVTISFDGTAKVHEYMRWPSKWDEHVKNILLYKSNRLVEVNLWSTITALNAADFENMISFAKTNHINHSYSLLTDPVELDVRYSNHLTLAAKKVLQYSTDSKVIELLKIIATERNNQVELNEFIARQDALRSISIENYI